MVSCNLDKCHRGRLEHAAVSARALWLSSPHPNRDSFRLSVLRHPRHDPIQGIPHSGSLGDFLSLERDPTRPVYPIDVRGAITEVPHIALYHPWSCWGCGGRQTPTLNYRNSRQDVCGSQVVMLCVTQERRSLADCGIGIA